MASIDPVDMSRAMTSESYAASLIRSNKISASQRGQIVAHWGSEKVKFWESVDSTEYQISDEELNAARAKGKNATAESVGYDGSKNHGAWGDVAIAGGAAAGQVVGKKVGEVVVNGVVKKGLTKGATEGTKKLAATLATGGLTKKAREKGAEKIAEKVGKDAAADEAKKRAAKNIGDVLTVILASAEVAKYLATKPNKEQYEAIMKLFESEYPQGIDSLEMAQESMIEATEETQELTDEAQEVNDEANETIEDDKTKMDFYKAQYEALVMKANAAANGGEPLTADEKKLLEKLAPLLVGIVAEIGETNEGASEGLTEVYDQIGEYQDRYDEGAETIAEVQGVTDYGEGFDESTQTMCYVESAAQGINGVSAGLAAAKLAARNVLGIFTAFVVMGGLASAASLGKFLPEQLKMASDIGEVIDKRKEVQDLEDVTTEVYEEELDNYAGNFEIVEDMEIEIPEDMEVPDEGEAQAALAASDANAADGAASTGNPFIDVQIGADDDEGTPAATRGAGGDDDKEETIPTEKDPSYVSKMGAGRDWTEVTEGNVSRGSDDEIVTKDGKVLLTGKYCDAITRATGAKEGEVFSKSDIPKILSGLLGDPFTVDMIKKVKAGKELDSEYAAKILKTKSQENAGEGTVDNSKKATEMARKVIDFYYPIFDQAATKGWVKG